MLEMKSLQTLLRNSIDYAGLYPPAGLELSPAVENYARYRSGGAAWALGRFVLPAGRLSELETALSRLRTGPGAGPWGLAALPGPDLQRDLELVASFNRRSGMARVNSIELKVDSPATLREMLPRLPDDVEVYIELPLKSDPAPLLALIGESGARAKARTGGVTPDAFPQSAELLRFLAACIRARIPFKATAGLHHPLRAEYRLTYAPDSAKGFMFGFLNVFLATAFLRAGMNERQALQVLEEQSAGRIQVEEESIAWRGHPLSLDDIRRTREAMISFGSCSFTEPLEDLQALGLLETRVSQA
jgi:hypothetical protein